MARVGWDVGLPIDRLLAHDLSAFRWSYLVAYTRFIVLEEDAALDAFDTARKRHHEQEHYYWDTWTQPDRVTPHHITEQVVDWYAKALESQHAHSTTKTESAQEWYLRVYPLQYTREDIRCAAEYMLGLRQSPYPDPVILSPMKKKTTRTSKSTKKIEKR